jgi:hypothetical protein
VATGIQANSMAAKAANTAPHTPRSPFKNIRMAVNYHAYDTIYRYCLANKS